MEKDVFNYNIGEFICNRNTRIDNAKAIQIPQEDQFANWESMLGNDPSIEVQSPTIPQEKQIDVNPIRVILERQKKKETISIPVEIKVEIPNPKVMALLDMMFDREEVTQELIKLITASIDVDSIVGEIESQIRSSIEDSYEDDDKKEEIEVKKPPIVKNKNIFHRMLCFDHKYHPNMQKHHDSQKLTLPIDYKSKIQNLTDLPLPKI